MIMKRLALVTALACLGGCMTQIPAPKGEVLPSTAPLAGYSRVFLAPIRVEKYESGAGSVGAVTEIETELVSCMTSVFPGVKISGDIPKGLLVEPIITDIKKVTPYERLWFGFLPGSSAVLMKVRFVDTDTKAVLAEPVFYARAAAIGGAVTIGYTDGAMVDRVAAKACDYAKSNL